MWYGNAAAFVVLCALRIARACRIGLEAQEYATTHGPGRRAPLVPLVHRRRKPCTAFIFWHIEATGGRSILSLMTSYIKQKFLLCASTSSQRDYVQQLKNRTWVMHNTHIFAEHHLHKFGGGWLAAYNRVRPVYSGFGCKLVVGAILREPVSLFWSWYRHFGSRAKPIEEQARSKSEMLLWSWGQGGNFSRQRVRSKVLRKAKAAIATLDWIGLHSHWDESIVILLDLLGLPLPPVRPHVGGAPPVAGAQQASAPAPPLVADFDCTWTNGCCVRYPKAPHCVITATEQLGDRAGRLPASAARETSHDEDDDALVRRLNAASIEYYQDVTELFDARLQSRRAADPSFTARVATFSQLPVSNSMFGFEEVLLARTAKQDPRSTSVDRKIQGRGRGR